MESDKISNIAIFLSIVVTLFWAFIFSSIFFILVYAYRNVDSSPWVYGISPWLFVPIYLLLHPIIGKVFSVIVEFLCDSNDAVYNFENKEKWGDWKLSRKLYFAAWWPITAPIGLIFNSLALVYGLLIKGLFK